MSPQLKLCRKCNVVKDLNQGYYRAGKYYHKFCIACHNEMRNLWKNRSSKSHYQKRPVGFARLEKNIQDSILYDLSVRINMKEVAQKYSLNYLTLLAWKKRGYLVHSG